MARHVGLQPGRVPEEPGLTQLVQLVRADGGKLPHPAQFDQVGRAGRHPADARPGEGCLAGGTELIHQVRAAGLLAQAQNVRQRLGLVRIQVVHTVGIVPENAEILGCGLQVCKPL